MEITFRELIRGALGFQEEIDIPIDEPKLSEFGFIATNVAFALAKNEKDVSPLEVANRILAAVEPQDFICSVDGGGFINGSPTDKAKLKFLNELDRLSWSPACIEVDWSGKYLAKALSSDTGEEARILLSHLKERNSWSIEDSLELLALLGDPELEAWSYIKDYQGKNNIPWLVKKFGNLTTGFDMEASITAEELVHPTFSELLESILRFRGRFERAVRERRPERALQVVLAPIKAFFSVYNRPEIRRALLERDKLGSAVVRLAFDSRYLVFKGLGAIKLPEGV